MKTSSVKTNLVFAEGGKFYPVYQGTVMLQKNVKMKIFDFYIFKDKT